MPWIDAHAVTLHGVVDLVDDSRSRSLDAQHLCDLDDVVGRSVLSDDSCAGPDQPRRQFGWWGDKPWVVMTFCKP